MLSYTDGQNRIITPVITKKTEKMSDLQGLKA